MESDIRFTESQIHRIIAGLVLAIFVAAVDSTLVSVALLSIGKDLGHMEQLPWVMSGYLAASAVATPIYGKLSDLYGRRPLMLGSLLGFALTSMGSALAPSMAFLIFMRILQGLTGGAVIAMAQATIADIVTARERGRYQGWLSATFASAAMLGPVLGGYLTGLFGWRMVFAAMIPLTLLAIWRVAKVLRLLPVSTKRRPIDWMGALWLSLSLSSLMSFLTLTGQGHRFTETTMLLLVGGFLLSTALCIAQERRAPEPIIPPSILSRRGVWVPCVNVTCIFFMLIGLSNMLPIAMQSGGAQSVDEAALRMLPLTLGIPCGAFLAGRWTYRTGASRRVIFTGLSLVLSMLGLMILIPVHAVKPLLFVMGFLGLGSGMVMVVAQSSVPAQFTGITTAVVACCRTVGSAVGVSTLAAVLFIALRDQAPNEQDLRRLLEIVSTTEAAQAFKAVIVMAFAIAAIPMMTMLAAGREIGAGLRHKP
ncbi:MAG: hypothetical protein RLY65_368 [Pseudomonadota bacterium]